MGESHSKDKNSKSGKVKNEKNSPKIEVNSEISNPNVIYNPDDIDECPICLDKYAENIIKTKIICGHCFCKICITKALEIHPFCPLCRRHIKPEIAENNIPIQNNPIPLNPNINNHNPSNEQIQFSSPSNNNNIVNRNDEWNVFKIRDLFSKDPFFTRQGQNHFQNELFKNKKDPFDHPFFNEKKNNEHFSNPFFHKKNKNLIDDQFFNDKKSKKDPFDDPFFKEKKKENDVKEKSSIFSIFKKRNSNSEPKKDPFDDSFFKKPQKNVSNFKIFDKNPFSGPFFQKNPFEKPFFKKDPFDSPFFKKK